MDYCFGIVNVVVEWVNVFIIVDSNDKEVIFGLVYIIGFGCFVVFVYCFGFSCFCYKFGLMKIREGVVVFIFGVLIVILFFIGYYVSIFVIVVLLVFVIK